MKREDLKEKTFYVERWYHIVEIYSYYYITSNEMFE